MNLHILIHVAENPETNSDLTTNHDQEDTTSKNDHACPKCNHTFAEKQQLIVHVAKHGLKVQRWNDKNVNRENSDVGDEVKVRVLISNAGCRQVSVIDKLTRVFFFLFFFFISER